MRTGKPIKQHDSITVFLCNIRSAQNAGAIMRTADAIGASEVVFGGYTPGPEDRFGRTRSAFVKASLGAEKNVAWRQVKDCTAALKDLKKSGAYLVAVEQSLRAIAYKKVRLPKRPIVVIMGNEVDGLPKNILALADAIVQIPMCGKKESLNVSVAAGIVLYRFFDV